MKESNWTHTSDVLDRYAKRLRMRAAGRPAAADAPQATVSCPPGGLRRDDLRRDGHLGGIENNARDIAGDVAQLVRLTDPDGPA